MKTIYWRPRAISRSALCLIALLSLGGWLLVEHNRVAVEQPHHSEKLAASDLAQRCFAAIKQERLSRGIAIDIDVDPLQNGLVGQAMSVVTSSSGVLSAKQDSINPNFAAVVVDMLRSAGVRRGDTVAIGYSGSFPALNICVAAAIETLELKPVGISGASASQWGANFPDWLWIDMEKSLRDGRLINFRSSAASLGGVEDRGLGMSTESKAALKAGIERAQLPLVETDSFASGLESRMQLYRREAGAAPIKAYINVGGGTTSVGKSLGKKLLPAGLNTKLPAAARDIDSVMTRFLADDVPVLHLVRVRELARRYGLPVELTAAPKVGEGQVYERTEYNKWYAAAVLLCIVASLYAFIRSDWGFRVLHSASGRRDHGHPEPMV